MLPDRAEVTPCPMPGMVRRNGCNTVPLVVGGTTPEGGGWGVNHRIHLSCACLLLTDRFGGFRARVTAAVRGGLGVLSAGAA